MYYRLIRVIEWLKENIDLPADKIDSVLNSPYFKDIEERFGEVDEETVDKDDVPYEILAIEFLKQIGITNSSPMLLKYYIEIESDDAVDIHASEDIGIISKIWGYFDYMGFPDITEIMTKAAIYGFEKTFDYMGYDQRQGKYIDNLLKAVEEFRKPPLIDMHPEDEEIYGFEKEIDVAIKILKLQYNLSDEQVEKLSKNSYSLCDISGKRVAGDCNEITREIRIDKSCYMRLEVIMHEMIHSLGVKEEGLTELLAQNAHINYKDAYYLYSNVPIFDLDVPDDPILEGDSFGDWSYYEITQRYRELFKILKERGLDTEIINLVLNGNNIKTVLNVYFGELESIEKFYDSTQEMQKSYYSQIHEGKALSIDDEKEKCEVSIFEFSDNLSKHFSVSKVAEELKKVNKDTTLREILNVEAKILNSICGKKSSDILKSVEIFGGIAYISMDCEMLGRGEEHAYWESKFIYFRDVISIISKKYKLPEDLLIQLMIRPTEANNFVLVGTENILWKPLNDSQFQLLELLELLSKMSTSSTLETEKFERNYFDGGIFIGEISDKGLSLIECGENFDAVKVGDIAVSRDIVTEKDFEGETFNLDTTLAELSKLIEQRKKNVKEMPVKVKNSGQDR